MTFKEFLVSRLQLYFILVTLIFAVSMVVGLIFTPGRELYYYQLVGPFLLSALCVLPTFVTYFRKEPTVRQFILRHILQWALIECVVLTQIQPPAEAQRVLFYIVIGAAVLGIYLIASLLLWLQKLLQSKKLTEQLKALQATKSNA